MKTAARNRLIIGAAIVVAAVFIGYQMYYSQTPARHADHDHAIAKIDAGGFLWVENATANVAISSASRARCSCCTGSTRRRPATRKRARPLRFAATVADDPMVDVLIIADAPSWEGLEAWAQTTGVPMDYPLPRRKGQERRPLRCAASSRDSDLRPAGIMAHQARGPMSWSDTRLKAQIEQIKGGVDEIH